MLSGSITPASIYLVLSCFVRCVRAYFVLPLSLPPFPCSLFRPRAPYVNATHVALWPFLLEILPSVQLGASDPGHRIPFFISSFLRLISPRLRSPPHKADSNYTRDTGIPPRVRSAGQLKNNRSFSLAVPTASILVSRFLFLFFFRAPGRYSPRERARRDDTSPGLESKKIGQGETRYRGGIRGG